MYLDNSPNISGSNADTYRNVPPGHLSLLELNINRTGSYIYPFVQSGFNHEFGVATYGDYGTQTQGLETKYTSSYPLSSSIYRSLTTTTNVEVDQNVEITINRKGLVLYNIGKNKYSILSKRYVASQITSSNLNLVNIPSVFYGSSIKKGTTTLKYYITGTLIASANDNNQNGELISDYGSSSGSVVGLIYYDEGVMMFPKPVSPSDPLFTTGDQFTDGYFYGGTLDAGNSVIYDGIGPAQSASWGILLLVLMTGYSPRFNCISFFFN